MTSSNRKQEISAIMRDTGMRHKDALQEYERRHAGKAAPSTDGRVKLEVGQTEAQVKAALSGPYAADVAEYFATLGGDPALDLRELLTFARRPKDAPDMSGQLGDDYRSIVRAAAGLAGITLGGPVPASTADGQRMTPRQESVLAGMASYGMTMSTLSSYLSLHQRGLAERIPGWRRPSLEDPGWRESLELPKWRLTEAGRLEGARALVIAGRACGA